MCRVAGARSELQLAKVRLYCAILTLAWSARLAHSRATCSMRARRQTCKCFAMDTPKLQSRTGDLQYQKVTPMLRCFSSIVSLDATIAVPQTRSYVPA